MLTQVITNNRHQEILHCESRQRTFRDLADPRMRPMQLVYERRLTLGSVLETRLVLVWKRT